MKQEILNMDSVQDYNENLGVERIRIVNVRGIGYKLVVQG